MIMFLVVMGMCFEKLGICLLVISVVGIWVFWKRWFMYIREFEKFDSDCVGWWVGWLVVCV